ncbi:hypothetical protein ACO2Q3_25260 [Caulobacter sp. KR2-114]|uniref:hypothetical protein n=1 Tax=Caulobacter sp. KR2-114 TaxID=3400912 RepID=UPI003BFD4275
MTPAVPPVPEPSRGLWRREVITAPGFRDETTRVLWLQTETWYADIRVPIDRPGPQGEGFGAYADAELITLARIQGFAGQLAVDGDTFFWRRDLDVQPASGDRDEARCSQDGEVLVEDGLHADYQEIWRREAASRSPQAAYRLEGADREGLLVIGGEHLIEFVARPGAAPVGPSLAVLVEAELAAGRRAAAEALLGTRIRYARRSEGGAWITRLSSMPWLEGRAMLPAGAEPAEITPDGGGRWRRLDVLEEAAT